MECHNVGEIQLYGVECLVNCEHNLNYYRIDVWISPTEYSIRKVWIP